MYIPSHIETRCAPRSSCRRDSAAWSSRQPTKHLRADRAGAARITSTQSGDKIVLTDDFEVAPAIIYEGDYPALLQVESTLGRKASTVFLLEKSPTIKPDTFWRVVAGLGAQATRLCRSATRRPEPGVTDGSFDAVALPKVACDVPPGQWPGGTGESPVPPSNRPAHPRIEGAGLP